MLEQRRKNKNRHCENKNEKYSEMKAKLVITWK